MLADYVVIAVYIAAMLGIGWIGMRMARTKSDYLVAGRRLGWFMYSGTMSAIVLGGASTIGGVGLGYTHGISGAWLVLTIGLGILALHAFFARRLVRLRVYTVSEMLDLRYGGSSTVIAGVVMWGYTLMLTVTSTLSFATIFHVLFGLPSALGIVIGGAIVVLYSVLGGMWSITLTDIAQFVIKTVGIMLINKINRRTMLLGGFALVTAFHLLVGASAMFMPAVPAKPYIILVFVVAFVFAMQGTLGPLTWLLLSEIFPLKIRSFAMGLCVFVLWMADAGVTFGFPPVVAALGIAPTFFLFAGIGALGIIFVATMVPETRGKTLEEVEAELRGRR